MLWSVVIAVELWVLDIKCPFCIRNQLLFEAMDPQNKVNMCLTDANGEFKLKKSHP